MKFLKFARTLALIVLGLGSINITRAQEDHVKEEHASFSIHEWGVFTAPRNAEWLQQDMLREWQGFPDFFQGVLPKRNLLYRGPVTKPVIFFHQVETDRRKSVEQAVSLTIHFANGQPLIWWPPVEFPATGSFGIVPPDKLKEAEPYSVIQYRLTLAKDIGERKVVPDNHWLTDLRKVKSTPFSVHGSASAKIHPDNNWISESFIYYDGLMKPPAAPSIERTDKGLSIHSDSDHDWYHVYCVDRQLENDAISIGHVSKISKGQRETQLELATNNEAQNLDEVRSKLKKHVVASGLHDDEAESLLSVWDDGLFKRRGLTLFYQISPETYDEWIPLVVNPKPKDIRRVGLVVHHHLEPELNETIEKMVEQLNSEEFAVRDRAEKLLNEIGGAAAPALKQIVNDGSPELRMRARQLLKRMDTKELLQEIMQKRAEATPFVRRNQ